MGLDITAYRQLKPVQCVGVNECMEDHAHIWSNGDDFPGRDEGVTEGCYEFAEEHDFRAGSYGGYSVWREQLAKLADYPAVTLANLSPEDQRYGISYPHASSVMFEDSEDDAGRPFIELVDFSDCEGTIGPVVSKKLAEDFRVWQPKADERADEYFRQKYADWRKAFEMAADGGAVCFH